jgi:hypothetical protein
MPENNRFRSELIARLPFSSNIVDSISRLNPKYNVFDELTAKKEERLLSQSVVYGQPNMGNGGRGAMGSVFKNMNFYEYMYSSLDTDKIKRIQDYRRMAAYTELSDAIDEICDECIVYNEEDNTVVKFKLNGSFDRDTKKEVGKEWAKFCRYFNLEDKGWEYFRNFLIDGEIFFENIISQNRTDFGVLGVMNIPTELINPVYDNVQNGLIKGYLLRKPLLSDDAKNIDKEQIVFMEPNQVTYIHSGLWNADKTIRLPYIENARRPYKQLSLIEDSIVIYRLVRAPERLVFKVDVGNMGVPEAESYMKRLMHNYWSKKTFDFSGTGMQNSYNPQSTLDAFWFPKRNGQSGTEVETLQGGQNLGQLDDLMYFVKKLYKSLKIPVSRLDSADPFKDGTEITREELRFAKFIMRIQRSFAMGMKSAFIAHLKLRGFWEQYKISEDDVDIKFNMPTSFGVMREQQIFSIKFDNYSNMSQNEGIANSYAQRYYLGYSDAQMAENREWLRKDAELQWEIEQLRTMGPDFYENQDVMNQAEADIMGGGGGGASMSGGSSLGMDDTPPDFGPGPEAGNNSPQTADGNTQGASQGQQEPIQ